MLRKDYRQILTKKCLFLYILTYIYVYINARYKLKISLERFIRSVIVLFTQQYAYNGFIE